MLFISGRGSLPQALGARRTLLQSCRMWRRQRSGAGVTERLQSAEREHLDRVDSKLRPGHALLVAQRPLPEEFSASLRFCVHRTHCWFESQSGLQGDAVFCSDSWPFADQSVRILILHRLDQFSTQPEALLQEAARIVEPAGELVLFGVRSHRFDGQPASRRLLTRILNDVGFRVVAHEPLLGIGSSLRLPFRLHPAVRTLDAWTSVGFAIHAQRRDQGARVIDLRQRKLSVRPMGAEWVRRA